MGFLAKIRNYIKRYKNRDFRTSIHKEKSQKYLFRDQSPVHIRSKWNIFKKKTNRLSPFSRFIQAKVLSISDIALRQRLYLGYIGTFLIGACFYIVAYSPYFHISPSKVMMEALTEGIDVSIANRTIEDLYGKSVFLIDEAEIANSIKKYQKNIKEIRIDRLYPNGLKILLTAYPIYFDVTTPALTTKSWGMTENGILIPRDEVGKPGKYKFVFYGDTLLEDTLLDYKELLPESRARVIEKTLSFLEENWPDMKIEKTYYFERENELHIVLAGGAHILFTLQDFREKVGEIPLYKNLKSELLTLKTFLTDKKSDVIGGKYTYIDVRIPGKVFSCSEKNLCLSNLKMIYGEDYK